MRAPVSMSTHANTGWSCAPTRKTCRQHGSRAVITMSIGARPFVQITRPLMEVYAAKVGADFHVVDSQEHVALREHKARLTAAPLMLRFLKLPLLDHFLGRYWQVLYLDDDTLVGPRTPDLFAAVPCGELGAVVERHKPQTWHAMHWRTACELYGLPDCEPKTKWLFNSGPELLPEPDLVASHHSAFVQPSPCLCLHLTLILTRLLLLSQRHRSLVDGWQKHKLECRVLCDQLFLNAAARREQLCVRELGLAFNYVGSELRRPAGERAVLPPARRRLPRPAPGPASRLTTRLLTTANPYAGRSSSHPRPRAAARCATRASRTSRARCRNCTLPTGSCTARSRATTRCSAPATARSHRIGTGGGRCSVGCQTWGTSTASRRSSAAASRVLAPCSRGSRPAI